MIFLFLLISLLQTIFNFLDFLNIDKCFNYNFQNIFNSIKNTTHYLLLPCNINFPPNLQQIYIFRILNNKTRYAWDL